MKIGTWTEISRQGQHVTLQCDCGHIQRFHELALMNLATLKPGCKICRSSPKREQSDGPTSAELAENEREHVKEFLGATCYTNTLTRERTGKLYKTYKAWCGTKRSLSKSCFGRRLTQLGHILEHRGSKYRLFLRLK